jgi:hypothetical protein
VMIVVKRSGHSLNYLRDGEEFIPYRAHAQQTGQPSVLLLVPTSTRPHPERNLNSICGVDLPC